ncbi:MAG TPA: hypothetical protein VMU87_04260 [Stellaceae bacterium]|nr:hypothetical protein [Stellaceae bacterium]
MAEQIDADLETLRGDIGQMRADITKLTETLQALVRHGGSEAMEKLRETGARVKGEATRTGQSLAHEIEERPVAAAVAAFVAGMVLGALFSRRT